MKSVLIAFFLGSEFWLLTPVSLLHALCPLLYAFLRQTICATALVGLSLTPSK